MVPRDKRVFEPRIGLDSVNPSAVAELESFDFLEKVRNLDRQDREEPFQDWQVNWEDEQVSKMRVIATIVGVGATATLLYALSRKK